MFLVFDEVMASGADGRPESAAMARTVIEKHLVRPCGSATRPR
ncbi:hypothetical protein SFR_0950 [Streptomyces sp. FR-008]|nr:hypothetical protein SFR_0950 [Streptomyces sp. FR-008]